jgi:hypothetical protein
MTLHDTDFALSCVILQEGRFEFTCERGYVLQIEAPSKHWVWFENSAHMLYAEEPGRVLVHLVQDALPFAVATGDVAP